MRPALIAVAIVPSLVALTSARAEMVAAPRPPTAVVAVVAPQGASGPSVGVTLGAAPSLAPMDIGSDGQAVFADVSLGSFPIYGRPPIAAVGFFLPDVTEHKDNHPRPVAVGSSSSETVHAWTAAVVFGAPPITRNPIDQWVALAYAMGPRRR